METLKVHPERFHVVAEIGHNHQGSVATCIRLLDEAKASGASSAKLQKRDNPSLFDRNMYDSPYTNPNSFGATYGSHRENLELSLSDFKTVVEYAREIDLQLWSTAFDMQSVDFLVDVGIPAIKIASGDLRSTFLIEHAAGTGLPIVVSTGGADWAAVDQAYGLLSSLATDFAVLQCTSAYPAAYSELNLRVIPEMRTRYPKAVIGYSGHENGIVIPVAAYLLGAQIIEKHFTLDRTMKGTDHAFSLEPQGLRKMVRDLRRTAEAIGSSEKIPLDSEKPALLKMSKKIVLRQAVHRGEILTARHVEFRSPGDGLAPDTLGSFIGLAFCRDAAQGEALKPDMFNGD